LPDFILWGGSVVAFIDYARDNSFEKEQFKIKFLLLDEATYPEWQGDESGSVVCLPNPKLGEDSISFLGFKFPDDDKGRALIARLFRASVYHLSAHSAASRFGDFHEWGMGKNRVISRFVQSLIEDLRVNAFISAWYPDRLQEIGYASVLSLKRMRAIDNIRISATRVMASLTVYANSGLRKVGVREEGVLDQIFSDMDSLRAVFKASLVEEKLVPTEVALWLADEVYRVIMERGPIIEAPFLPFTESLGANSLFPPMRVDPDAEMGKSVKECVTGLGGTYEGVIHGRMRAAEAEAQQVFKSFFIEKEKQGRMLAKYEDFLLASRFKSMGFPPDDYTGYLRAKARVKRETSKLTERLLTATNAFMEDVRKKIGVVNLTDAIQVIASKSDRTDVFLLEEQIEKDYAWAILIDASVSMRHIRDYTLDMAVALTESASKVLLDVTSWGVFAFNDRFHIIKDFPEQYNTRVRSRLGGLRFEGTTYLPDAIEVTGRILARQNEELKIMMVISDGWPYGYPNIYTATTEAVRRMEGASMAMMGIGAQSGRMEFVFNSNVTAFNMKDFINRFGAMFVDTALNAE
jgi:hypothetical protein